MFYLQKLYLFSTYILLILYQSSPYIIDSLPIANILFAVTKRTLYNSQMYSLQRSNLYFNDAKQFDSSNQISREQVESL